MSSAARIMSYRELRNFTEVLRQLGYPRLISLENFRKPNFELVADILYWMVKLYDPDTTISDRVEFESERVDFLTHIASLMAAKARIKLNTKKLYASDGRAVQELLKLAVLLSRATMSSEQQQHQRQGQSLEDDTPLPPIKVQDIKAARTLASEITLSGAKLFDMLAFEAAERQERMQAIRFLDQSSAVGTDGSREQAYIERSVKELIDSTKQQAEDMRKECEELEVDERNLESKIRKKQEELERTEKRLRSVESVRPQFLEEAERLEADLQRHYETYMEKHRNLDYLEHELEQYHAADEERRQEQERRLVKLRERLMRDEVEILRGNKESGGGGGGGDAEAKAAADDYRATARAASGKDKPTSGDYGSRKSATSAAVARAQMARSRATGSLEGAPTSEDESSEDEDTDESRSQGGLSDDDELSVSQRRGAAGGGGAARGGKAAMTAGSDEGSEDFLDDDDGGDSGSDENF